MTQVVPDAPASSDRLASPESPRLLRQLCWLALPVLAEHLLHMMVGINDTYLANHLDSDRAAATAAVGTISYLIWFIGLIVGAVGTGSAAIIARATGARHRSLANSVCGQSMSAAVLMGCAMGIVAFFFASPIANLAQLSGPAHEFAISYLRILAWSLPFVMPMFVANACLRGAGDTISPAVSMIVVDVVNIVFSWGLTYGWFGMPKMGFDGIAVGTAIAYVAGGLIQFGVLVRGRGGIRLHLHRMRPHWLTLKRIARIGIPNGIEGVLQWAANFSIIIVVNRVDPSNAMAAAHINTIRIESISFMLGFAFATAASTLVGQSLGMRDVRRATRSAYLAYAIGGGLMTLCGVFYVLFPHVPARWMSGDAHIADLTARALHITGFIQCGFASAAIFGGALRGAGDTLAVMKRTLGSVLLIRLPGVLIVGWWFNMGLTAVWIVLSVELFIRGLLIYARFVDGGWKHVKV